MSATKLKILVLADERLIPKERTKRALVAKSPKWQMEADVVKVLYSLGYDVNVLGVLDEVDVIIKELKSYKPNVVFNLLEEFNYNPKLEAHVASILEMLGVRFTGANSQALSICKDKLLAKKILISNSSIKTPKFIEVNNLKIKEVSYPLIVKARAEEGSFGLSLKSVVNNKSELKRQIAELKNKYKTMPLVEEYIVGKELYVGVLGSSNPKALPVWEFLIRNSKVKYNIATSKAKWNKEYQKKLRVVTAEAKGLSKKLVKEIQNQAVTIYKELSISGYARIDFRLTTDNQIYFIEANPNPNLSRNEDFARSAIRSGYSYEKLIQEIIKNS
jgi:D-alanine-D-alanine ligase